MIDRVRVRRAIAAFHKNKERITLAKLARTTGYRYGQLYCEIEFRRFAKKRVKKAPSIEVVEANPSVEPTFEVVEPAAQIVYEMTSTVETTQPAAAKTTRAMGSAKLELQVSEWLRLEMKFPIPEKKRRLVHAWVLAALDFAGETDDDQANEK
jgi:hypothetical protein